MPKLKQQQTVVRKYTRAQARSSRLKSLTSIFGSAPWRNKASTHGLSSFIMAICKGVIPEKETILEIKLCPTLCIHSQNMVMTFEQVVVQLPC